MVQKVLHCLPHTINEVQVTRFRVVDATHSFLTGAIPLCSECLVRARGASADEPISLQRLVILDMLGKLTQRIPSRRAFGASEESHSDDVWMWD